jgi:hypothetical protein
MVLLETASKKNFIFGYFIPITDLILDNGAKIGVMLAAGLGFPPGSPPLAVASVSPRAVLPLKLTDFRGDLSNANNRLFWPQPA